MKFIKAYKYKKCKLPPLAAFDFETEGLGGKFIIAAICTTTGERTLFYSLDMVFEYIINHPEYRWLAHNAAGYEFSYLYPYLMAFINDRPNISIDTTIQGLDRLIQIRIIITRGTRKVKIDLRDSAALFSMPLADVAKAFCPEFPKLKENINFETTTFNPENPGHIEYVFRDCDIILVAYQRHFANMESLFGVPLGLTAGSTAYKAWKATLPDNYCYGRISRKAENFIRNAYYGAIVLPGHYIGHWGPTWGVDINGAYAYQMMTHEFPIRCAIWTSKYQKGRLGFYHVHAHVPAMVFDRYGFSPVPYRSNDGLQWRTGHFDTYISSIEMEFAISLGCTFKVIEGYYFTLTDKIFRRFALKCQELEIAEEGRYKQSVKPQRNSLYGYFGSKPIGTYMKFGKNEQITYMPAKAKSMADAMRRTITIKGVSIGMEEREAEYMMVHWAALVTAYQRVYIMQFVITCYQWGARNVYVDTDSIKCDADVMALLTTNGIIPIGNNYGQFKLEMKTDDMIVSGPKCVYAVNNLDGKEIRKSKGVPVSKTNKDVYEKGLEALNKPLPKKGKSSGREIEYDSVDSAFRLITRGQHVKPVRRKRTITDIRNSNAWDFDTKTGRIYPKGYLSRDGP